METVHLVAMPLVVLVGNGEYETLSASKLFDSMTKQNIPLLSWTILSIFDQSFLKCFTSFTLDLCLVWLHKPGKHKHMHDLLRELAKCSGYQHEFAMKLYDLFSIFNLTAQKLITFPRRLTEGERATAKAQNGKTLSFSFLLYACVCVFVNVCVCELLVSFHSFPFSFGCLSCMCFCRFLTLSTTLLHFSKDFCSCIELLACTFIDAIAIAGCNANSTAVWWEFIFILCCLFITCIYTAREKQRCQNKVSKGSNENEHDNDKWRKETRKNHAKRKIYKENEPKQALLSTNNANNKHEK